MARATSNDAAENALMPRAVGSTARVSPTRTIQPLAKKAEHSAFWGGVAMAFAMPADTLMAVHAAPAYYAGSALGIVNCLRQIGSLLGVALLGSLVAGDEFLRGFHSAGLGASVASAAAIGLCPVVTLLKH
ncbi:hypothetical protein [Corynebacterium flavescens]|uniref:hypothetical protein n=1 Tax=Corynebacterium flavescens TaxID=28028 RepID=UPI003FD58B8C